jgi:hypothetical protein
VNEAITKFESLNPPGFQDPLQKRVLQLGRPLTLSSPIQKVKKATNRHITTSTRSSATVRFLPLFTIPTRWTRVILGSSTVPLTARIILGDTADTPSLLRYFPRLRSDTLELDWVCSAAAVHGRSRRFCHRSIVAWNGRERGDRKRGVGRSVSTYFKVTFDTCQGSSSRIR